MTLPPAENEQYEPPEVSWPVYAATLVAALGVSVGAWAGIWLLIKWIGEL